MNVGRVKRWFDDKGYGFIKPLDGGDDVFCHFRDCVGDACGGLPVGLEVTYDVETDQRSGRLKAVRVKVA